MRNTPARTLLRRAVAALAVATAVAVPSLPASAGGPTPAALAGTTVITGERSATMQVTLRTSTSVLLQPGFRSADAAVSGGGRYAGVVLTRDDSPTRTALIAATINFCGRPGCLPKEPAPYVDAVPAVAVGGSGALKAVLPAGSYHLQLVADGAPVTVTLRLTGLPGRTRLTPRGRSIAAVLDMARSLPLPAGADSYYSAGTTHALPGGGVVLTSLVTNRTASAGRQSGMCLYKGSPPPGSVYLPECPNSSFGVALTIPEVALASTIHEYGGVLNIPSGTWSMGQYELTAGPTQVSIADALWVPFN